MLRLWDILLFWMHILIIAINLFGWIPPQIRKWHLPVVAITLFSWLALGIWYGFGYCFLTDWHWAVKRKLGADELPTSFVKYFLDRYTCVNISANAVDIITVASFSLAIVASIYFNYCRKS